MNDLPHHRQPLRRDRQLAQQMLSRAAGAPLLTGNALELLIDAPAHYERWLAAIRGAQQRVLLENYIIRDDAVGRQFRDTLAERARAGVFVAVVVDWLGCLGLSRQRFWRPLREAGGHVRIFNPPQFGKPLGWISRDHRKVLVVDGVQGFLSGVCISTKWLGDAARSLPPWRDTGVGLRGPAVARLEQAFARSWAMCGTPLPEWAPSPAAAAPAGSVALRVIATRPSTSGMYRLDQQIAALAQRTLWITDAYFVGVAPTSRRSRRRHVTAWTCACWYPAPATCRWWRACPAPAIGRCSRPAFACSSGTVRCCTPRPRWPTNSGHG